MTHPNFYNEVKQITLYDPLSEFLGSFEKGIITYKYIHVVKLAGHSCPTVAGAYLMTLKGLEFLYGSDLPVRGEIKVEFKESIEDGVAGVIANVMTFITGATTVSGFKGLNGKYARHGLMAYAQFIPSNVRFTRTDTGKSVDVFYDSSTISPKPEMQALMQKYMMGTASEEEKTSFRDLWQQRVKEILIDNYDNPQIIRLQEV